ncbi:MAG: hypothetical protein ACD_19C00015G0012 [uncultured bacterium]|nr:MAG: hypothetical protein ACD_19C00015G0012 [uncultured bacterium]
MIESIASFLNDLKIPKDFDGTAKLYEYYRLPTLSIFKKKSELNKEQDNLIIEPFHVDIPPAKDDS